MLKLAIWAVSQELGTLSFDAATGLFDFSWQPDWLKQPQAYPLSPALNFSLPTDAQQRAHSVRRFFENLLPEGKALDDIAAAYVLSKANLFGLLQIIGKETTGALSLLPIGATPAQQATVQREINLGELSLRIRNRPTQPFNIWDGKVRMSIAGLQDKLAVYIQDQRYFLVEGQLASTHILKPEPERFSGLVANEHFCLTLARQLGVDSAYADIIRAPEPVLCVRRFDRMTTANTVNKLHIIDGCQALDLPPTYKYERNFGHSRDVAHIRDGVSLPKLFALSNLCVQPAQTRVQLARWTILQYLLGNSDAHGKNISFFQTSNGLRLAPAYDLLCIVIYPNIEHELAMAIGEEFRLEQISAFDWADFAQQVALPRTVLLREMRNILKKLQLANLVAWPGYTAQERNMLQQVCDVINQQAKRLELACTLIKQVCLT